MQLLIDGDGIGYRCGFAVEKAKYLVLDSEGQFRIFDGAKEARGFEEGHSLPCTRWSRKEVESVENALHLVDIIIGSISTQYGTGDLRIFLSPSVGNFRDQVATFAKYKGNRDAAQRPVHYHAIFDYLETKYGAEYAVGQEADDSLGIALTRDPGAVCVSFDKDLLQVPGRHYNWVDKKEQVIGRKEGALRFYGQVLSGDATDNVPGCSGIGAKTATKILASCKSDREAWGVVLKTYIETYGNEEGLARAVETAKLVWIRREEGQEWSPPA